MNKDIEHIDELIVRQLTDIINASELEVLNAWLAKSDKNKSYYNQMNSVWGNSKQIMAFDNIDVEADYECFAQKVGFQAAKRSINRFSFRNIAAVMLPLIAVSIAITLYQTTPGFGKWVAYESSYNIEHINLPDQSAVDLNSGSKLVYRKNFKGEQRSISLEGEGFFQVAKNPLKPFVVSVGETTVKVLGTAFYLEEDNNEVTLIVTEGKVQFSGNSQQIELIKGESAVYSNGKITKSDNLPMNNMAWRTGRIEFDKADLNEVTETLLDHFNEIEEIDNQTELADRVITTKFESPSLDEVLIELRIHFDKNFTLDGKKLVISD